MGLSSTSNPRKAHKKRPPTASGLAKPQKPRGPKTAYNYFYEEERKIILEEDDPSKAVAPSKHHKIIGQKWRRIGKGEILKKYQALAEEDNKRYEKENEQYKKALELFKDEEEKALKRRREEEEKAASLVRESIQAYGEREGRLGGPAPALASGHPMATGLTGFHGLGVGGQEAGRYLGSAMGQAGGLAASTWALQDSLSPAAAGMQTAAASSTAGLHGLPAPAAGQTAGQAAPGPDGRPQVTELVQRLRKQRAALEETTDALLEASSQEFAAASAYSNLAPGVSAPMGGGSLLSGAGYGMNPLASQFGQQQMQQPSLLQQQKQQILNQQSGLPSSGLASLRGMGRFDSVQGLSSVGIPNSGLASSGQGLYTNAGHASSEVTPGSIPPSSLASGPIDANALLAQSLGQQLSGSAASRQPTYSELLASMHNPLNNRSS